jgi:hypothetical protein
MHNAFWLICAMAMGTPLAFAADPLCCRMFGIDATPILGHDAALCGKIVDADQRAAVETEVRAQRKLAAQCALGAQAKGRPFVYTYRMLVTPDVDMMVQGVFGAHGERLLLQAGIFGEDNIHSMEVCNSLIVLADGILKGEGCYPGDPLIDRLRTPPAPR